MKTFVRLMLLAAVMGAPLTITAPAGATSPAQPFEEVAAARDGTQASAQTRQRRRTVSTQRRHRDTAHRTTRRARTTQPAQG